MLRDERRDQTIGFGVCWIVERSRCAEGGKTSFLIRQLIDCVAYHWRRLPSHDRADVGRPSRPTATTTERLRRSRGASEN